MLKIVSGTTTQTCNFRFLCSVCVGFNKKIQLWKLCKSTLSVIVIKIFSVIVIKIFLKNQQCQIPCVRDTKIKDRHLRSSIYYLMCKEPVTVAMCISVSGR